MIFYTSYYFKNQHNIKKNLQSGKMDNQAVIYYLLTVNLDLSTNTLNVTALKSDMYVVKRKKNHAQLLTAIGITVGNLDKC